VLWLLPSASPFSLPFSMNSGSALPTSLRSSPSSSPQSSQLTAGRLTLEALLSAGEVRALDRQISQRAKAGELDYAFFHVLNVNIDDAQKEEEATTSPPLLPPSPPTEATAVVTTRLQILSHLYTRCQEEIEMLVAAADPGVALVVKLMRMSDGGIRENLMKHNLAPPKGIVGADGVDIGAPGGGGGEGGGGKALVSAADFVAAIASTVEKVRSIDPKATTLEGSADAIENLRQIGILARGVVLTAYGESSGEVGVIEEGLQEVFMPKPKK